MQELFLKALLLGFFTAAPVGIIGVLCINRTLSFSIESGFVSGLGAATASAIYSCIAGFALVALTGYLLPQAALIKSAGGAFLVYLGLKFLFSPPLEAPAQEEVKPLSQDFYTTFLLFLKNPVTFPLIVAVFASFGIVNENPDLNKAIIIMLALFLGALFWWFILSLGIYSFKKPLNDIVIRIINVISGIVVGLIGFAALFS